MSRKKQNGNSPGSLKPDAFAADRVSPCLFQQDNALPKYKYDGLSYTNRLRGHQEAHAYTLLLLKNDFTATIPQFLDQTWCPMVVDDHPR